MAATPAAGVLAMRAGARRTPEQLEWLLRGWREHGRRVRRPDLLLAMPPYRRGN
jgi:hypothetical protein